MKKIKKNIYNVRKILSLQLSISKIPIIFEIMIAILEKTKTLIEIVFPALLIDLLISEYRWKHISFIIIIFAIAITLIDFFLKRIKGLLSAHASRMDNMIMLKINQKSMSTDYKDVTLSKSMEIKEKAKDAISEFLEIDYILFTRLLGSMFSLVALGYLTFRLDTIVLLLILTVSICQYFLSKKSIQKEHTYEIQKSVLSRKRKYIEELLFEIRFGKEIRTYNGANYIKDKFLKLSEEIIEIESQKRQYLIKIKIVNSLLQFIQTVGIYLFAIYKYTLGITSIGIFTIYLNAAKEIANAIREFFDSIAEIAKINVYFEDYVEYMNLPTKQYSRKIEKDNNLTFSMIEFRNVSFKYPDSDVYILKNISFKVNPRETISIVGENGAGKTTLVYLLMRLYEVEEGEIYVNNINIYNYSYDDYVKLIAPVFQDYRLFSYSIKENIVFDNFVDEKRLQDSYHAADLLEKIKKLSNGDETILTKDLSDEGEDISIGEKQKLAIARAYYRNGDILIFDEPTASIDPLSEHRIYKNIDNFSKDKITVFISHRLTSTLFSDKILVLEKGQIIESGNHTSLIEKKGVYAEMFEKQAYYYQKKMI